MGNTADLYKNIASTSVQIGTDALKGVGNIVENICDFGMQIGSWAVLNGGITGLVFNIDKKLGGDLKEQAEAISQSIIETDVVDSLYKGFYEKTEIGKMINEDSYVKYDSVLADGNKIETPIKTIVGFDEDVMDVDIIDVDVNEIRKERLNRMIVESQENANIYGVYIDAKRDLQLSDTWKILKERYKNNPNIRVLEWENGSFLNFNIGKSIETPLSNSFKLYVPVNQSNAASVTSDIMDFLIKNNIASDNKIAKYIRDDALVLRIFDVNDAMKITNYINNELPVNLVGSELPLTYRFGNVHIAMDGSTSYHSVVTDVFDYYFKRHPNASMKDFSEFVSSIKYNMISRGNNDVVEKVFDMDYINLWKRYKQEYNLNYNDAIIYANANIYEVLDILESTMDENIDFTNFIDILRKYQDSDYVKRIMATLSGTTGTNS